MVGGVSAGSDLVLVTTNDGPRNTHERVGRVVGGWTMQEVVASTSKSRRSVFLLLLLGVLLVCALFLGADFPLDLLAFALAVLVGVFGFPAWLRMGKNSTAYTLKRDGFYPGDGGRVPWTDVTAVAGVVVPPAKYVRNLGIQLRSYDAYINSLSPEDVTRALKWAKGVRIGGAALVPFNLTAADTWVKAALKRDLRELIPSLDLLSVDARSLVGVLAWNRKMTGCELMVASLRLPGPVDGCIQQVSAYRNDALGLGA